MLVDGVESARGNLFLFVGLNVICWCVGVRVFATSVGYVEWCCRICTRNGRVRLYVH